MSKMILKLYVNGQSAVSKKAIADLQRICEEQFQNEYDVEIIDVLERPQLAEDEKILATPTLIRQLPLPIRRIIGDLSGQGRDLLGLDLIYHEKKD